MVDINNLLTDYINLLIKYVDRIRSTYKITTIHQFSIRYENGGYVIIIEPSQYAQSLCTKTISTSHVFRFARSKKMIYLLIE